MRRVLVIGCPGGGKSTFARALQAQTGLPVIYLDRLYWNSDRTTVPKEIFRARLAEAMAGERWIIDGNYAGTLEMRLAACDTAFFLDYPAEVCLAGVEARRGKSRPDMPWVETERDEEFLAFIRDFEEKTRPRITAALARHPEVSVIVFHSREDAAAYLASCGEASAAVPS